MSNFKMDYKDKKAYFDQGIHLCNDEVINHSLLISNEIDNSYYAGAISKEDKFEALKDACQYLDIFQDNSLIERLQTIGKGVPVVYSADPFEYGVGIVWPGLRKNDNLVYHHGEISEFVFSDISTEFSKIFIAHEMIHAFKDTNGKEIVDCYINGETLPLFFELVILENEEPLLAGKHYNYRLSTLRADGNFFAKIKNSNSRGIYYQIALTDICEYLNSYYYALLLYNQYKRNPRLVLAKVLEVLYQEKTTTDILNDLGLINMNDQKSVVKQEITRVKKLALESQTKY